MNSTELEFDRLEFEEMRALRRRVKLLSDHCATMQAVLFRHQWGASGHCPECAAGIATGKHTNTCEIAKLIEAKP